LVVTFSWLTFALVRARFTTFDAVVSALTLDVASLPSASLLVLAWCKKINRRTVVNTRVAQRLTLVFEPAERGNGLWLASILSLANGGMPHLAGAVVEEAAAAAGIAPRAQPYVSHLHHSASPMARRRRSASSAAWYRSQHSEPRARRWRNSRQWGLLDTQSIKMARAGHGRDRF